MLILIVAIISEKIFITSSLKFPIHFFKEKNNEEIIINQDHYHSVIYENDKYQHIEAEEDKELKEMEEK